MYWFQIVLITLIILLLTQLIRIRDELSYSNYLLFNRLTDIEELLTK